MGAYHTVSIDDEEYHFFVRTRVCVWRLDIPYPSCKHFQQRISPLEWSDYVNTMARSYGIYRKLFCGSLVGIFIFLVLGAFVYNYIAIGAAACAIGMLFSLHACDTTLTTITNSYNVALFRHRGIVVSVLLLILDCIDT